MTGGVVVVLGETGRNFAAGMSGGISYVYDPQSCLYSHLNSEMVSYEEVESKYDQKQLFDLISKHYQYTSSSKAKMILDDFDNQVHLFKKIIPHDYKKMIDLMAYYEKLGLDSEQAQFEAFYQAKKGA